MGRDPFRRGFNEERQWLHSHAERGNDQLSSGDARRGPINVPAGTRGVGTMIT
jgi:hypothetical protein